MYRVIPVDAESIQRLGLVRVFMFPIVPEDFHLADAVRLETLVDAVGEVIGPDVNVVGVEFERLHTVVLGGLGMGRGVVFQDDGLLAVDGTVQGVNLGGVALPADEIAYKVSRASMRLSTV